MQSPLEIYGNDDVMAIGNDDIITIGIIFSTREEAVRLPPSLWKTVCTAVFHLLTFLLCIPQYSLVEIHIRVR